MICPVVLAAGAGRRMGTNKLSEPLSGRPVIRHVVEALAAAGLPPPVVVLGHAPEAVRGALEGLDVAFVEAPDHADGMGRSLAAGIAALPMESVAALVCLGDMPFIAPELLREIVSHAHAQAIVAPVHAGQRGHPVLWGSAFFPELRALQGDEGARRLFSVHADAVRLVPWDDDAIHVDIDTPAALAAARARFS